MTNAQIIEEMRFELLDAGLIRSTGKQLEAVINGEKMTIDEPEQIHTYAMWQQLGYQVQKGQKAVAKFRIWKHTSKRYVETDEVETNMLLTMAAFFSASQVKAIA